MAFVGLPGLEVVAGGDEIKTGLLGCHAEFHELRHSELLVWQHEADLALVPGQYTGVACTSILREWAACRSQGRCAHQDAGALQDGAPVHEPQGLAALTALSQSIRHDLSPRHAPGNEGLSRLWHLNRWL